MRFLKNKKNIIALITFAVILFLPIISFAQQFTRHEIGYIPDIGLGGNISPEELIGNIIRFFLGLLGFIALIIVIISGFKWMTSGGNQEKISKAKQMLGAGIVGLLIILFSYIITTVVMRTFLTITDSGGGSGGPGGPDGPQIVCNQTTFGQCMGCNYICGYENGSYQAVYDSSVCFDDCSTNPDDLNYLKVISLSPSGNNVNLCSNIQVKFNKNINLNTVNKTNFPIYKCNNFPNCTYADVESALDGEYSLGSNSSKIVKFNPSSNFEANSTYCISITTDVQSVEGFSLLRQEDSCFSTGAGVDNQPPKVTEVFPNVDSGTGNDVCRNTYIKVGFSKDMDEDSLLNSNAIKLYKKNGNVYSLDNREFHHSVNSSGDLILRLKSGVFDEDSDYSVVLIGDKIKDSCDITLDGNENGSAEGSPTDNFPPNTPPTNHASWHFITGQTYECRPIINSNPGLAHYDGGDVLTITGDYLNGASLVFNNNINIFENSESCMADANGIVNVACSPSAWDDNTIKVKVPTEARSGNIKVNTLYGATLNTSFTLLSPRINNISPSIGGKNQFITIDGDNFGATQGTSEIYFRKGSQSIPAGFPCDYWTNNRIIISVPESMADESFGDWNIQIKKVGDEVHWSNPVKFTFDNNSSAGPGLCSVGPRDVHYEDLFTLTGVNLGTSSDERSVVLGNQYNHIPATEAGWNSAATQVTAKTPNLQSGSVGVRVVVGTGTSAKYSNFLSLNVLDTGVNALNISYIEPESGPVGSYVTIYGSGFGSSRGNSVVRFKTSTDNWIEGDFVFPSSCSTNFWNNSRIIVKVPDGFSLAHGSSLSSSVKVVLNEGQANEKTSNEKPFEINTQPLAPSICGILPASATAGETVNIFGEYFGNNKVTATFHYINGQGDNVLSGIPTADSVSVVVPATQTGPVAVKNEHGYGNTVNFEYIQGSETPTTPPFDFYGWNFTTCEKCGIPRVRRQACSSDGTSSPTPFPGYQDVPVDMNIYAEFEYADKTAVNLDFSNGGVNFYKCSNNNQNNCTIPVSFVPTYDSGGDGYTSSITLDPRSNLDAGTLYKVSLSSEIKDFDGSSLIPFEWYFKTNSSGGACNVDTVRVYPDSQSVIYDAGKTVSFGTQVWASDGCYQCANNYQYEWSKEDPNNLVDWVNPGTASTSKVKINSSGKIGNVFVNAENLSFNISDNSPARLSITLDCTKFNTIENEITRQNKCSANNCCWNAQSNQCLNHGNAVCGKPFVLIENCISSGNETTMGSPSPQSTNTYSVPVGAKIFAKFAKSGGEVSMNESTYSVSGAIKVYKCNSANGFFDNNACMPSGLNIQHDSSLSNGQQVLYNKNNDFDPGFWYKVVLNENNNNVIKDATGQPLQTKTWWFKTGSGLCNSTNVAVSAVSSTLAVGENQKYTAISSDNNCTVCSNNDEYYWSMTTPNIAHFNTSTTQPNIFVTADNVGQTKIKAQNKDFPIFGLKNLKVVKNVNCSSLTNQTSCNNSGACCWSNVQNKCLQGVDNPGCPNTGPFKVLSAFPTEDACPNTVISVTFDSVLDYLSLQDKIFIKSGSEDVDFRYSVYLNESGQSVLIIEPTSGLKVNTSYTVYLNKGIRSSGGGSLICSGDATGDSCYSWGFKTGASVCSLRKINIVYPVKKFYEFNNLDDRPTFTVQGLDSRGNAITQLPGVYDWKWNWSSQDTSLVDFVPDSDMFLSSAQFMAKNKNGKTTVTITAEELNPPVGFNGSLDDKVNVEVFLCLDPWNLMIDNDYNFSMKYCKDGGLPHLSVRKTSNTGGGLLREYILSFNESGGSTTINYPTNNTINKIAKLSSNSFVLNIFSQFFGGFVNKILGTTVFAEQEDPTQDVIGIRIYKNPKHLDSYTWYYNSGYVPNLGRPTKTKIDSYSAVQEGTTVYVNAGNKVQNNNIAGSSNPANLYTTIYLMSHNPNATSITRGIIAQLKKNWTFNINLTEPQDKIDLTQDVLRWEHIRSFENILDNYAYYNKYCAYQTNPIAGNCPSTVDLSYKWIDDDSDGVIESTDGNGIINNGECYSISKEIRCSDDEYCKNNALKFDKCLMTYPLLESGTYKKGMSVSVWPSWSETLSSEVGGMLPIDPINKMAGECSNGPNDPRDPVTCWDAVNSNFMCPAGSHVYIYKSRAGGFDLYTMFNNNSNTSAIWDGDSSPFMPQNRFMFDNSAICNGSTNAMCGNNSDCPGDCQKCNLITHECESTCSANKPHCFDHSIPVDCLDDVHCTEPCHRCDSVTHECVNNCSDGKICSNTNQCVQCVSDRDCTTPCSRCVNNNCRPLCAPDNCINNHCSDFSSGGLEINNPDVKP